MTPKVRCLALACALVALLAGCSSSKATSEDGPSATNGVGSLSKESLPPGAVNPYASPFTKKNVAVKAPLPKTPTAQCPKPDVQPLAGQSIPPSPPWIIAAVNADLPWEKTPGACPFLFPGADCWIPFAGAWRLDTPTGSLVFQAFENGSTKPLLSDEVGPIPGQGRFHETSTGMPYRPTPNARSVTFRIVLKNAAGVEVAATRPETLPVPGCKRGTGR